MPSAASATFTRPASLGSSTTTRTLARANSLAASTSSLKTSVLNKSTKLRAAPAKLANALGLSLSRSTNQRPLPPVAQQSILLSASTRQPAPTSVPCSYGMRKQGSLTVAPTPAVLALRGPTGQRPLRRKPSSAVLAQSGKPATEYMPAETCTVEMARYIHLTPDELEAEVKLKRNTVKQANFSIRAGPGLLRPQGWVSSQPAAPQPVVVQDADESDESDESDETELDSIFDMDPWLTEQLSRDPDDFCDPLYHKQSPAPSTPSAPARPVQLDLSTLEVTSLMKGERRFISDEVINGAYRRYVELQTAREQAEQNGTAL